MQQIPFLHAALRSSEGIELARDDPQMFSPIIHGKDENGDPARSHDDAFFLPTDVDKDGRIDHVTIYAAGRFSRDDVSALDRLRRLSYGKDSEIEDGGGRERRTTHRLMLIGLDREPPAKCSIFGPSVVWESSTPYLAFRHPKLRGKKRDHQGFISSEAMPEFMKKILSEDWDQRSDLKLPKPQIEFVSDLLKELCWRFRSLQFRRARRKPGDDGYSRPFGVFRLTFSEPVRGPIGLGHDCHFGMGSFRPTL